MPLMRKALSIQMTSLFYKVLDAGFLLPESKLGNECQYLKMPVHKYTSIQTNLNTLSSFLDGSGNVESFV